jgi:Flp pilus assembly pilin Flp
MEFYVVILYGALVDRVRAVRSHPHKDRGASALEWAIIAAISVVMATVIGAVIYHIVSTKSSDIKNCANQPVGATCSP